ncbi:hypothetical protein D9M69_318830 [compost metagenome]
MGGHHREGLAELAADVGLRLKGDSDDLLAQLLLGLVSGHGFDAAAGLGQLLLGLVQLLALLREDFALGVIVRLQVIDLLL